MKNHAKILLSALSLGLPLWAAGQPTRSEPAPTSPATPTSTPAPEQLNYISAFSDYQAYKDLKPGDWRAANDAVGKAATGHSGSGSGMGMTAQPSSTAPASAQTGHQMGGGQK